MTGSDPSPLPDPSVVESNAAKEPNAGNGEVLVMLRELGGRLELLESKFDNKIQDDESRKAIVDRLHAEVQEYRSDLLLQMLKPVLLDLITLYDNVVKAHAAAIGADGELGRQLRQRLDEFRTEVEDALSKQGVELYVVPGDAFEPRWQQAVKTQPAASPEWEGKVAERLRPGFKRGERILRPERVVVFVKPSVRP